MDKPTRSIDTPAFFTILILVVIGIIMMFSTSSVVGYANYNDSFYFIKKHFFFLSLGGIAFLFALKFPHQRYKDLAFSGFIVAILLIVGTFIPGIGVRAGGAQRWLSLGFIVIQPVEIMKFFLVIFLASSLSNKHKTIVSFAQGLFPILAIVMIPILLLAKQPDLGNVILCFGITLILIFLSPAKLSHLLSLGGVGVGFTLLNILKNPYQMDRIRTFISPWDDPQGKNYHIIQSFIAIGSGGLWGLGLGQSKLKYYYLPLQYSDFIFSIVCEEGGFILASSVILLFGILFYRGIRIAMKSKTLFSFYLGVGVTLLLVLQALLNIGVVIGVLPVTGIPLTFVSFGGTSLITSLFLAGTLLNISKYTHD